MTTAPRRQSYPNHIELCSRLYFVMLASGPQKTCFFIVSPIVCNQGDQIGLIFAYWTIFYFVYFLKITKVSQILGIFSTITITYDSSGFDNT
jgi:hypothetical protein